ncbi:MAG: translation initiation factor IF-2 [Alphaproteobacteria bacterium]|nr:translation initiation factor IF-2 [Alphaproteobacteria bacterium]
MSENNNGKAPITLSMKKPLSMGGNGASKTQVIVKKKRSFGISVPNGVNNGAKASEVSLTKEQERRLKLLKEEEARKADDAKKPNIPAQHFTPKANEAKKTVEEKPQEKTNAVENAKATVAPKKDKKQEQVAVASVQQQQNRENDNFARNSNGLRNLNSIGQKNQQNKKVEDKSKNGQNQNKNGVKTAPKKFDNNQANNAPHQMTLDELEAAEQRKTKSAFQHKSNSGKKNANMDEERTRSNYKEVKDKWSNSRGNMNAWMRGDDDEGRGRSLASIKRAREKESRKLAEQQKPVEKVYREVVIPETITVQELASRMSERGADVVKQLMKLGVMATITQTIDADTAELIVTEMGHKPRRVAEADVEEGLRDAPDKEEDKLPRPPVITVMGHVDHGKTSLLDALRETNVVAREAGGITQHIGAYQVTLSGGQKVTFIDTPGHAAFTEMRARGAKVTDIVILVVAANDGIMPQTIEAISHAKQAGVPIVVAINKIDVPGANPDKVRQDLMQHEVFVESLGGDVLSVEVSAKKRLNLDKLMEAVLLQAEMLDLKANPNHTAEGAIVEAKMEKGRGSVATILVQRGTLRQGDIFVAGKDWGRVKALLDENGKRVEVAPPAFPVEVVGFQSTPSAGDDFIVVNDEEKARQIASYRQRKEREALQVKSARSAMEIFREGVNQGTVKELPLVIKADVQGSVEAIVSTLEKIKNDKVKVRVIHSAVGAINESDVTLAKASHALIFGFNVRANTLARNAAKHDGIDIRYYSVIYELADTVHNLLEGLLSPELKEKILGYAKIREVFKISKVGNVAGCMVKEGIMKRGAKIRLLRANVVFHTGAIAQLKRFKEDVKEVRENFECGMSFENFNDFQVDDTVECYEIEEVAAKLENIEV